MAEPHEDGAEPLSLRHGVRCVTKPEVTVEQILIAMGKLVRNKNIVAASRMNKAIVVFVNQRGLVDLLVETGITSHARVSRQQHERFSRWHEAWQSERVPAASARSVRAWLLGDNLDDLLPCKTTCVMSQVKGQTVNRYQVHYSKAPASP